MSALPAILSEEVRKVDALEAELIDLPQVECPLKHRFAPGVYLREIFMPKGTFIVGQRHKTEHFNVILKGRARVKIGENEVREIVAPATFVSGPGVRKVLFILEDMVWQTVHPTEEADLEVLENLLIEKTDTFRQHEIQAARRELALMQ